MNPHRLIRSLWLKPLRRVQRILGDIRYLAFVAQEACEDFVTRHP